MSMFVMNDGQISHLTFSPDVLYLRQDLRSYFCSLSTKGLPKAVRDAMIEKTYQVFFESPGKGFKKYGTGSSYSSGLREVTGSPSQTDRSHLHCGLRS